MSAKNIGPQCKSDDNFKKAARYHQSEYRAQVLNANYLQYGNCLTDEDGRALMNYYDGLGVRDSLQQRYPLYSKQRDSNLLRSEHIPFNMFAPFKGRTDLTQMIIRDAFKLEIEGPFVINLEWAPKPAVKYLNDSTAFDTYIQGVDKNGEKVGIGIEVKYTESGYKIGKTEAKHVHNPDSLYWATTRESGLFLKDGLSDLTKNNLRQIWRNHLLGLAMVSRKDIEKFVSVTLYPSENEYITQALTKYQGLLRETERSSARGCTFEKFIGCLRGDHEIERWKQFLSDRYLVKQPM